MLPVGHSPGASCDERYGHCDNQDLDEFLHIIGASLETILDFPAKTPSPALLQRWSVATIWELLTSVPP